MLDEKKPLETQCVRKLYTLFMNRMNLGKILLGKQVLNKISPKLIHIIGCRVYYRQETFVFDQKSHG